MSLVSEYMILMCETIGKFCTNINAPVWYKIQVPQPLLEKSDLELQEGENNLLRALRMLKHLRAANDSKIPGPHCTSGAETYVQCTSPIRRYHDLYNHYRLKAAMHGASMGEEWAGRAKEEAGIQLLDKMASAEERIQTLNAVRRVMRHREQYWLQIYIERLKNAKPKPSFDCVVLEVENDESSDAKNNTGYYYYNVHALQLGCMNVYKMYSEDTLQRGDIVKCLLYKRMTNPITYVLIPDNLDMDKILIASELAQPSKTNGRTEDEPDEEE
jgi:exoribonuclease R